jgi:protein gp37
MADNSNIEWCDATINAINGCVPISPGCTNCYAMRSGIRNLPGYPSTGLTQATKAGHVWTGEVRLNETALLQPLRWKKPRRIFWNAHGDTFYECVHDEWIDRMFAVMALTPQHTHMVLTKRSDRMRGYANDPATVERVWRAVDDLLDDWYEGRALMQKVRLPVFRSSSDEQGDALLPVLAFHGASWGGQQPWPLRNVMLGVSVEDQARKGRIDELRQTPVAKRFISFEPLLEDLATVDLTGIDLAIAGGESGKDARPIHPDWVRSLRDQCAAAGTAFHFKQWGQFYPCDEMPQKTKGWRIIQGQGMASVGKHRAGRLLDGVEHNGWPS